MRSRLFAPLTVLAAAVSVVFLAGPASAHTSLIDVQPADGGTVSEGSTVTLTFSDDLLELGTEVSVTDAGGESQSLDVTRPTPSSVQVTLPAMASGPVTVAWRVVAGDGHPIEGALQYSAEGAVLEPSQSPMSAEPTPTVTAPAMSTASPSPSASPVAEQAGQDDGGNRGVNWGVWIAVAVAIFAATGAGVATKRRR